MSVFEKIKSLLQKDGISFEEFHHKPVRTSQEVDEVRPDYTLSQGAKAIIIKARFKAKGKGYFMLVLPGDKRIDSKKVRKMLSSQSFSFASSDEVKEITDGVLPGGVPPFGNLFDLDVYVDPSLGEHNEIVFNAGDRSVSIVMKYEDYIRLVNPNIIDFT